jgi:hypothetical protein
MDNLIILGSLHEETGHHVQHTLQVLVDLRWLVNEEKSSLTPSQTSEFLGFIINLSSELQFKVPTEKIHLVHCNINHLLHDLERNGQVPVQRLAAVVGLCVSLMKAVLPAPLMLRNVFHSIAGCSSWSDMICLSTALCQDLIEWRDGIHHWHGNIVMLRLSNLIVETDASLCGWGATSLCKTLMLAGWWNCSDHHINELELHVVWKACWSLNHHLHNWSVLFRSDNITMVAYLNWMGGCSPCLN